MHALLAPLARLASNRPGRVLAVLAALTVVFGAFSADQSTDTELTAFAPDSELAAAHERIQSDFGASGAALQVVLDAGPDGNVLGAEGLRAALAVEEAVTSSDVDFSGRAQPVRSFAQPVLAELDGDPAGASATALRAAGVSGLQVEGATELVSTDADVAAGTARAGLVVVSFPASMSDGDVMEASVELAERIDGQVDVDGIDVSPFNAAVLNDALQAQSEEEMPRLLGLSMLLILGILLFQYRAVSDVVIGLVGLVATIIWMMGIGVLLGPDYLGVVGPFSQIAMIVPVLLVGLGIDYAIHLTSRYREEQSHGQSPAHSAGMAVRTVGGALVLATVTTIVGFLTNVASPLPPVADFGIFTAVGVLAAFIIMTSLVPATRNLLDRRRAARGRAERTRRAAGGLGTVIGRVAVVAERAPRVALGVALVVSLTATGAATQVDTTFSQDDFIPEDSEIGMLLERIEDLFGGGLNETTYALVEGDLADPRSANAMLDVHERLADTPGVRSTGGSVQASSPAGLVASLAASDPTFAAEAAALGYRPDGRFAADADVAALYDLARAAAPARAAQVLGTGGDVGLVAVATTAGQEGARELAERLEDDFRPLGDAGLAATITSEPLVLEESLDALTDSQTQGIVITLVAALLLLLAYYGIKERTPVLGLITMVPSIAVVSWVLGTMWLLGITFNVLTAMVASLGIGIGVPFGIHVTHRFLEDRRRYDTVDEAVRKTVTHTGGAMAGSAATTAAGFGVLIFASLVPMQQFGMIVAITILYSFFAAVLIQPACLKLWGERRVRLGDLGELHEHEQRVVTSPPAQPVG